MSNVIERLLETPRMYFFSSTPNNLVVGLNELCKEYINNTFIVCEVGCFSGVSTELLAQYAKEVHAVDYWQPADHPYIVEAEIRFDKMHLTNPNILKHKISSEEGSKMFDDRVFDLVYIDADHNYDNVLFDVTAWYPKVKAGGFLAGHDFNIEPVKEVVTKKFPNHSIKTYSDDSWIIQI